jgi:hypothetical protein
LRPLKPFDVAFEDLDHQWRLRRFGFEEAIVGGEAVAERDRAAVPLPAGRLAFHARDYPLDDRRPLELSEHAEHLHHHPTC